MFKFSSEASLDGSVTVETKFIVEYMPYADGDYVKVYLYALSLAARKNDPDDSIERLARRLDLDIATVDAAFDYWTEQGLMSRLGDEVTFLSLRAARPKIKKYDVDKYREFNRLAQQYVAARQIAPNEYNEYYSLMEKTGLEWQAMVLIVKYCVNIKGDNVSCPYILAVARNLAADGYRTCTDVENRLEEYGVFYNELIPVLGAMGGKRPDHESVGLYKKWTLEYKFDRDVILKVAQTVKRGGAAALDTKLTAYRELGLNSYAQIQNYETERLAMYKLTKNINKALGVFYENVDSEIALYVKPWLGMGFAPDALTAIAEFSMKNGLKTLSDLDAVVRDFFASNALTAQKVRERIDFGARFDGDIQAVMTAIGVMGAIKPSYRSYYETWTDKWGFGRDVIDYAASLSIGKPFSYVNSILAAWRAQNVTTVDAAKSINSAAAVAATKDAPNSEVVERYSADELNALFTKFTDEE